MLPITVFHLPLSLTTQPRFRYLFHVDVPIPDSHLGLSVLLIIYVFCLLAVNSYFFLFSLTVVSMSNLTFRSDPAITLRKPGNILLKICSKIINPRKLSSILRIVSLCGNTSLSHSSFHFTCSLNYSVLTCRIVCPS